MMFASLKFTSGWSCRPAAGVVLEQQLGCRGRSRGRGWRGRACAASTGCCAGGSGTAPACASRSACGAARCRSSVEITAAQLAPAPALQPLAGRGAPSGRACGSGCSWTARSASWRRRCEAPSPRPSHHGSGPFFGWRQCGRRGREQGQQGHGARQEPARLRAHQTSQRSGAPEVACPQPILHYSARLACRSTRFDAAWPRSSRSSPSRGSRAAAVPRARRTSRPCSTAPSSSRSRAPTSRSTPS